MKLRKDNLGVGQEHACVLGKKKCGRVSGESCWSGLAGVPGRHAGCHGACQRCSARRQRVGPGCQEDHDHVAYGVQNTLGSVCVGSTEVTCVLGVLNGKRFTLGLCKLFKKSDYASCFLPPSSSSSHIPEASLGAGCCPAPTLQEVFSAFSVGNFVRAVCR